MPGSDDNSAYESQFAAAEPFARRSVLVLDDDEGRLGRCAMCLVELGIVAHYAADVDEIVLLAEQEAERTAGAFVWSGLDPSVVASVVDRVANRLELPARAVALAGARPADDACEMLRSFGISWILSQPQNQADARFVAGQLAAEAEPRNLRVDPRLPVALPVTVVQDRQYRNAEVLDLTAGGAFVAGDDELFQLGAPIILRVRVRGGRFDLPGEIRWRRGAGRAGDSGVCPGIGVQFGKLPAEADQALANFLERERSRFRL